jgi:hypothetical protein
MTLRDYPLPPQWVEELLVGARLQHFAPQWRASDQFLGGVLEEGVGINWLDGPPKFYDAGEPRIQPDQWELVNEEVKSMAEKLAILEIPESEARLICSLFLVAKKGGGQRPVINLKPLNAHTMPKHFKMEGIPVVKETLKKADFMTTVDLSDAFFHIPLKKQHQRFFQFRWNGKLWQFQACPFGWTRSPNWFQAFTRKPILSS